MEFHGKNGTDGAKSMTGSIKGVVLRIKKENSECSNSHYALRTPSSTGLKKNAF